MRSSFSLFLWIGISYFCLFCTFEHNTARCTECIQWNYHRDDSKSHEITFECEKMKLKIVSHSKSKFTSGTCHFGFSFVRYGFCVCFSSSSSSRYFVVVHIFDSISLILIANSRQCNMHRISTSIWFLLRKNSKLSKKRVVFSFSSKLIGWYEFLSFVLEILPGTVWNQNNVMQQWTLQEMNKNTHQRRAKHKVQRQ